MDMADVFYVFLNLAVKRLSDDGVIVRSIHVFSHVVCEEPLVTLNIHFNFMYSTPWWIIMTNADYGTVGPFDIDLLEYDVISSFCNCVKTELAALSYA